MKTRTPDRRGISSAGFTLIELMIVIVVLAIVVAIAVPVYTQQVRQSRRTEARTAVLDLASREEKYFSTANGYATAPYEVGYVAATDTGATFPQCSGTGCSGSAGYSTGNYYQITVESPNQNWTGNGASFIITAWPASGSSQNQDTQCTSFSVDQTGNQTATGSLGNSCWQQ